jgi:hypothetical protein
VAGEQEDGPDADGQLGHDDGGAAPGLNPVQAPGEGREQAGRPYRDERQGDAAASLVGLPLHGGGGGETGRDEHADGLEGLAGRGQAKLTGRGGFRSRCTGGLGFGGLGFGGLGGG